MTNIARMTEEQKEYEAALRRAFVDGRADYIVIYSRRQQFQIASAFYGMERGWLTQQICDWDEQSTEWRFRLTQVGRFHFGLAITGGGN